MTLRPSEFEVRSPKAQPVYAIRRHPTTHDVKHRRDPASRPRCRRMMIGSWQYAAQPLSHVSGVDWGRGKGLFLVPLRSLQLNKDELT